LSLSQALLAFNWDEARPGFSLSLSSTIGKLLPNALYVQSDALDSLEPLLRVYEGCARAYLGEVEGANLIKLHRHSGKVSYLVYPDFETDPHPALLRSLKLSLRTRELDCYDLNDEHQSQGLRTRISRLGALGKLGLPLLYS